MTRISKWISLWLIVALVMVPATPFAADAQSNETPAASDAQVTPPAEPASDKAQQEKTPEVKKQPEADKAADSGKKPADPSKKAPEETGEKSTGNKAVDSLDLPFVSPNKDRYTTEDRFDLDYAPSGTDNVADLGKSSIPESEDTPWYKHWGFWTGIGVAAFVGIILGVQYGIKDTDSLDLAIERR